MKSETQNSFLRLVPVFLAAGFFVLYLATCQRGWCWQDGGLFQRRIFTCDLVGSFGIAASHPLFIALGIGVDFVCRILGGGMNARLFATNASSAFWMALAVGFFAAAVRRYSGSGKAALLSGLMLGFAHMTWWMGTICEAHALELLLFALELFVFAGLAKGGESSVSGVGTGLMGLAFVCGLHFSVHNLALLALPVYAFVAWRMVKGRNRVAKCACLACIWVLGASPVLCLAVREFAKSGFFATVRSVLVGDFGSQVLGVLPSSPKIFILNCVLAAMSFAMPTLCFVAGRKPRETQGAVLQLRIPLLVVLSVHAIFLARYFVPDQAFFLLPTLTLAMLLVSPRLAEARRPVFLACATVILGVALPLVAASCAPRGLDRGTHPGRDDVRYFALPWKFNDASCDRYVESHGLDDTWAGYPLAH